MKILSNIENADKIVETTENNFVTSSEKTAITHSNRSVLNNLSEINNNLAYNGTEIAGSGASNLTDTTLSLGNYRIVHNTVDDTLDFEYIVG